MMDIAKRTSIQDSLNHSRQLTLDGRPAEVRGRLNSFATVECTDWQDSGVSSVKFSWACLLHALNTDMGTRKVNLRST